MMTVRPALSALLYSTLMAGAAVLLQPAWGIEPAGDVPLEVVSYNVRFDRGAEGPDAWPHRRTAVADVLREADLSGLQEPLLWQVEDLDQLLPEHSWIGVGRDDGGKAGELSPIFYRRDRLRVEDWGTFWLSSTPQVAGSKGWDAALPRIATWAVLTDLPSDQTLVVLNTHFDHRGVEAREQSASLLRREAQRIAAGRPLIVMGDFNATPGSVPHRNLLDRERDSEPLLRDAYAASAQPPQGPSGTFNGFTEILADRRIDHIFVSHHWDVMAFETGDPRTAEGRYASDHQPIAAQLRLP